MMKRIIALFIVLCSFLFAHSQENFTDVLSSSAAQGYLSTLGIEYSFTIGEVFVSSHTASLKMLTEGFHQGEILQDTIALPNEGFHFQEVVPVSLYPNPTLGNVNLMIQSNFDKAVAEGYGIEIFNAVGKMVWHQYPIAADHQTWDWSPWPSGIYFVKITSSRNKESVVFKILKK